MLKSFEKFVMDQMDNTIPLHLQEIIFSSSNPEINRAISKLTKSGELKGAQNYAIIRSITDTCKKNQQDRLNAFFTIATS